MKAFLLASLSGFGWCACASAAVITHTYTGTIGTITSNTNGILGPIAVGDAVSGSFLFDPAGHLGGDRFSGTIAITLGGHDLVITSANNYIRAQNNINYSSAVVDMFSFGFDSTGPTTELPFYVYELTVRFLDTSASVYDGSQTLSVDLNLTDYNVATWTLRGTNLGSRTDNFSVSGTITNIAVPETSTAFLFLGPTLWAMRRNRRIP